MYKAVLRRYSAWITNNFSHFEDHKRKMVEEKIQHTYTVLDVATKIAKAEKLSDEDIMIAQIVAILHDCGRFPQIKLFGSFRDTEEFKHADEGAKLLENGLLKAMLPETRQYDELIIDAVKYHGALTLPEMQEKTLLHSKIIRDADRTDLFNMCLNQFDILFWSDQKENDSPKLTPKVKELVADKKPIPFSVLQNDIDLLALRIGLINQYEFKSAKILIKEANYVNRIVDLFLKKRPYYIKEDVEWVREQGKKFLQ